MTKKIDYKVIYRYPSKTGARKGPEGYDFTSVLPDGKDIELQLYEVGEETPFAVIPIPEEKRVGRVVSLTIQFKEPVSFSYSYMVDGETIADPFGTKLERSEWPVRFLPEEEERPVAVLRPYQQFQDMILYKTNVRGFTMDPNSGVSCKGTFAGMEEKLPYLKSLGITALLLMPVYEFQVTKPRPKTGMAYVPKKKEAENYWGYAPGHYFIPKLSYGQKNAAGEFHSLVKTAHKLGMDVLLEFLFTENMPTSFVLEVLRYWLRVYGVDGFRLMGGGGWREAILNDPFLSHSKILMDQFPEGNALTSDGIRRQAEYHKGYEECLRHFLRGDSDSAGPASWYMDKNPKERASICFMADQDGMTMMDMVSYSKKHNEANGEDNRDGCYDDISCNFGVEGASKKRSILKDRERQLKNAFTLLMFSQGVPLIYGGDEFGNSQMGNNNAWCQDNELGWVNWDKGALSKRLTAFVKELIAMRKQYKVLHMGEPFSNTDYKGYGWPDLSYHGDSAWYVDMNGSCSAFGRMYCGDYGREGDPLIYLAVNMGKEEASLALPTIGEKRSWKVVLNTGLMNSMIPEAEQKDADPDHSKRVTVAGNTILVLMA